MHPDVRALGEEHFKLSFEWLLVIRPPKIGNLGPEEKIDLIVVSGKSAIEHPETPFDETTKTLARVLFEIPRIFLAGVSQLDFNPFSGENGLSKALGLKLFEGEIFDGRVN